MPTKVERPQQPNDAYLAKLPLVPLDIIGSYLSARDARHLSQSCKHTFDFFQPSLKKAVVTHLIKAVIDDDRETIEKILTSYHNPEMLLLYPNTSLPLKTQKEGIQSQLTWQRLIPEPPLVMALKRNQVEMVKLLLPYFKNFEGGIEKALQQWEVAEKEMADAKKRSEGFDFKSLIEVIAQETFPNGTDITTKLSDETEQALAKFREKVLPAQAIALSDYYDIEELLKAAFNAYDTHFNIFHGDKAARRERRVYFVKVIGFIQSLLSRKDAEVWCQGLYNVVENGQKIEAQAASLKLRDGESFYRDSFGSLDGLGFKYFVDRHAVLTGLPRNIHRGHVSRWLVVTEYWINYIEQKQQNLENLRSSYLNSVSQLQAR